MFKRNYCQGDLVVYRLTKQSESPGPRAQSIEPSRYGESYRYQVDKYWIIESLNDEGIVVRTRRGKTRMINHDDRCLRRANILERTFLRGRFPDPQQEATEPQV